MSIHCLDKVEIVNDVEIVDNKEAIYINIRQSAYMEASANEADKKLQQLCKRN